MWQGRNDFLSSQGRLKDECALANAMGNYQPPVVDRGARKNLTMLWHKRNGFVFGLTLIWYYPGPLDSHILAG